LVRRSTVVAGLPKNIKQKNMNRTVDACWCCVGVVEVVRVACGDVNYFIFFFSFSVSLIA
jgi:hypothetical protein